jgi:hypothetical protein
VKKAATITAQQIGHLKKLVHLLPLLKPLHDVGTERDSAGNRQLHFDEYVIWVLLYLFNPMITSIRMLQDAGDLKKLQEQLGVKRFSLGSFSESVRVFEPERLKEVIHQLAGDLKPLQADPRLKEHLSHVLTIVDGTVLNALCTVAAAMWIPFIDGSRKHAWRLHTHFDVSTLTPIEVDLTDARNSGKSDEKNVLRGKLKADHCYVMDRWFGQFTLFNEINRIQSSYVCRLRDNSVFEVIEERLLSDEALAAGVVRDAVVRMGISSKPKDQPDHLIRIVVIEAEPHEKRGGRKGKTAGHGCCGTIIIASNLLGPQAGSPPPEIIALIYRYRWTIETFFRFFKQVLGCRHLISQHVQGIEIQVYCAVIACMLVNLWTGKKAGKRMVGMLTWYFMGIATEADVQRFLDRPDNTGIKKRAKDELWKKLGVV